MSFLVDPSECSVRPPPWLCEQSTAVGRRERLPFISYTGIGSTEFQGKFLRGKFIWRVLSNGIRRNPRQARSEFGVYRGQVV